MTSRQEEAALTELDLGKRIELGMMVREEITGFSGMVVGRSEWLWGCVTIGVLSGELKDGKPVPEQWFDEGRIVEIEEAEQREPPEEITGGPARSVPSR